MISFNTPCFKYKLFAAWKTHWGFAGFVAPHQTRYLTKTIRFLLTDVFFPGAPASAFQDTTLVLGIDRNTGIKTILSLTTAAGNPGGFPDPCPTDFTNPGSQLEASPAWTINSETEAVYSLPGVQGLLTQYFVTLADEYTLTELEGDVDGLLAAIDPSTVQPQHLLEVTAPGDNLIGGFDVAYNAIPNSQLYPALEFGGLSAQPVLKAAAFTAYLPSVSTPFPVDPPIAGLIKLASQIAMAGNYCEKTFTVDYSARPVGAPQCVSGIGTCSGWFTVDASPLEPNRNTYKLVVPDCRCD